MVRSCDRCLAPYHKRGWCDGFPVCDRRQFHGSSAAKAYTRSFGLVNLWAPLLPLPVPAVVPRPVAPHSVVPPVVVRSLLPPVGPPPKDPHPVVLCRLVGPPFVVEQTFLLPLRSKDAGRKTRPQTRLKTPDAINAGLPFKARPRAAELRSSGVQAASPAVNAMLKPPARALPCPPMSPFSPPPFSPSLGEEEGGGSHDVSSSRNSSSSSHSHVSQFSCRSRSRSPRAIGRGSAE
jgi:hypothetical protein